MDDLIARIITELEEFSGSQYPDPSTCQFLTDLQSLIDSDDADTIERFFADLSSRSHPPASLVRPISAAMDSRLPNISLLSSNVYLSLLLLPNSPVFSLFAPVAFLSLLSSIRRYLKQRPQQEEGAAATRGQHAPSFGRKRRGRGSRNTAKGIRNEIAESHEGEFDLNLLFCVLEKLGLVLDAVHLDRFPDSLKSLIQTICEIPVMGFEVCGSANFNKLAGFCERVLETVLNANHGDLSITSSKVLKSLTPLILMGKSAIRAFALRFVTTRVKDLARDSGEVKKAVLNLPKYIVHEAPEKAEARASAVEAVIEIVNAAELEGQIEFVKYVMKMAQGKPKLRILAVDLIPELIMSLKCHIAVSFDEEVDFTWVLSCLEVLIQRCSDSSASVRARALSNLAQVVGMFSSDDKDREFFKEALRFRNDTMNSVNINDVLKQRCVDEKAAVRKAALFLVTKLVTLIGGSVDCVVLKMMGMACADPLVSIRKAAMSALSEAFKVSSSESVVVEWLHSVPRMITDNESSIQGECENLFLDLVLERICRAGSTLPQPNDLVINKVNTEAISVEMQLKTSFPGVADILKEICNSEVTPWVKKICLSLGKKKKLKPKIAFALQNIIKASESLWLRYSMAIEKWTAPPGAWFLLSEVSAYLPMSVEWEFMYHHWQLLDKSPCVQGDAYCDFGSIESNSISWAADRVYLLQTISNISIELPSEPAAHLAHNLLQRIEDFSLHLTEVDAHIKALRTLCKQKALNSEETNTLIVKWVKQLLSKAYQIVENYISKSTSKAKDICFSTPETTQSRKGKRVTPRSGSESKAITAIYTIGSLVIICPFADISTIIPLLHTIITSRNKNEKLNRLPCPDIFLKQITPSLYNQAWLTMGKICLADEKLAKRYIPLFVQELEKSDCAALRNNLVVVMADFCVHYTAMVDCYIAKITECLCDPNELVRRQTFILLSKLLQRDYVKWRGVLFLRFLLALVDESEKIRQLAHFLFSSILKAKAPLLAYNSFIEAIYFLNDCHAHNRNSDAKGARINSRAFSIRGNDAGSKSKRMQIYATLLKQMAPEHLLTTFAKLCAEVLAAASDGMLDIEEVTGQSVLQDAFQILSCKEMRLSSTRGTVSEAADMEDSGDAGKVQVITQAVRKSLIQNTTPIFIELKRLLESKNSPLTGPLMECLRILLKDYKNEIDDILVADKQLRKELIYDMQKYEAAKARSTAASCGPSDQNKHRVAEAAADVVPVSAVRSMLEEVNKGKATPALSSMSVPKLKTAQDETTGRSTKSADLLESVRRRQTFVSDDED